MNWRNPVDMPPNSGVRPFAPSQTNNEKPKIMKNKLHILVCITALSVLPLWAGDSKSKTVSVEQRFRETDLSLALRQYERMQMEAFEARLKIDLLETEDKMTQSEREKTAELLAKRVAILKKRAAEFRDTAYKLEAEIDVAKAK